MNGPAYGALLEECEDRNGKCAGCNHILTTLNYDAAVCERAAVRGRGRCHCDCWEARNAPEAERSDEEEVS